MTRAKNNAGRHQLVNDRNHQPIIRNSRLVDLGAKLISTPGNLIQFAGSNIEHVNRAIWNGDEQIASARE